MDLYLAWTTHCTGVIEPNPDDEWDAGETFSDVSFGSLTLDGSGYCGRIPCTTDTVDVGDTLYVVAVVYSTGNTFGRDNGGCVQPLIATPSRTIADAVEAWVGGGDWPICSVDEPYMAWIGYFESLDYVFSEQRKVVA